MKGEPLVLRSDPRFAGAISSLRFRGVEHLDATDHGRLLQGAVSFDRRGECLNPTQAGASRDGGRSTSRLLAAEVDPAGYRTVTRMAYWLRPGQTCRNALGEPRPAANRQRLSDVTYEQRLTPGWRGQANAIHHAIVITTAAPRSEAVVEALTAYTPSAFSVFLTFDPARGALEPDGTVVAIPGEQARAIALATPDGRSAIALFSPDPAARFGRFAFPGTNKLNVVFRPSGPYLPGPHAYEAVTVVGSRQEVEAALRAVGPESPPSLGARLHRAWAKLRAWARLPTEGSDPS